MKYYSVVAGICEELYTSDYGISAKVRVPLVDESDTNAGFGVILAKASSGACAVGDRVRVGVYDYYDAHKGTSYRGLKRVIGVCNDRSDT